MKKSAAGQRKNKARPASVKGTGKNGNPGIRLDFDDRDEGLGEISWDACFEWSDKNHLALLCSRESRFNKLVSRD